MLCLRAEQVKMNIHLANKAAIVTGAGRGIGLAIARMLAEAGASLLLVDIDEPALVEAKSALSVNGAKVQTLAGDLTSAGFAKQLWPSLSQSLAPSILS
jgi:NAD(P)-dependent dehydrogenase (short-subunit alcohol dehydrogenase family)